MRTRIRKTQWSGTVAPNDVAESFRDVQSALDSIPEQCIYVSTPQQYTEPMTFATDDARVPRIVTLARVLNADEPTTPVAYGAVCWEYVGGAGGQIKVHDIASMSTGATRYSFTWKVEW
jgi:hypothetical protein